MVFTPTIEDVPTDRIEVFKIGHVTADDTKYVMVAVKIKGKFGGGKLGHVTDGWFIVNALNNRAYMFQSNGGLDPLYVADKLGNPNHFNKQDTRNLTKLLSKLLGRPAPKHGIMMEEE